MVGIALASTHHSLFPSGPVRFGLWSNTGKCVSGSSKWWCHGRCYDPMRVLWNCSHTSSKPIIPLGDNIWPRFHLNSPFFLRKWARLFCLMVKCWLAFTSARQYLFPSGPVRFGLWSKFVSGSSKWWWHWRCCDAYASVVAEKFPYLRQA